MVKKANKLMTILTLVGAGVVGVNSAETVITNVSAETVNNINLASPDLDGKEHLGDGDYRLYLNSGVEISYNVFSGIWTIYGTTTSSLNYSLFNVEENTEYALSYIALSGTISEGAVFFHVKEPLYDIISQVNENVNKQDTFVTTTQNVFGFWVGSDRIFDNLKFKLQLEKGDTVTPYTLPIAPIDYHYSMLYDGAIQNAYDTGYYHGEQDGYDLGFQDGRTKDYNDGYLDGYNDGNDDGYDTGYYHGEQDGYELGYDDAFNESYDDAFNDGYYIAREEFGYKVGDDWKTAEWWGSYQYAQGLYAQDATGFGSLLTVVFGGFGDLLAIEILPGIYIGAIIAVPLVFGIIFFILGKRKGD